MHIVVFPERWNLVGTLSYEGEELVLTNCAVIRYWGTPNGGGLGKLAKDGPTSKTMLDPCPDEVRSHVLTKVFVMKCTEAAAKKFLRAMQVTYGD